MPIDSLVAELRELGLIVAVLIGFGFGFVLERAGFGNAKKLAAQFYLHDMTVFKVMFSAIVTAMGGLVIASGLGLVDLRAVSESAASFTYLWPMLAGGLALGAGFIISGYCPGTSLVSTATGNIDGAITFLGVIVGSFIYGEIFPLAPKFHTSGDKGHLFLYDILGVPAPLLAAGIILMALGMFYGAEKVERIFKRKKERDVGLQVASGRGRMKAIGVIAALALLAAGTLALPGAAEKTSVDDPQIIGQKELATRVLEEPWRLRILDLRAKSTCAKRRIPGAECTPFDTVNKLGLPFSSGTKDLILLGTNTLENIPRDALAYPGRVYILQDGFKGWTKFALDEPAPLSPGADAAQREAYRFQASLHIAMTGMKAAPPPTASAGYVPTKKKKKGGGCS